MRQLVWVFTRRWPYVCQQCLWPALPPAPPVTRPVVKPPPSSAPRLVVNTETAVVAKERPAIKDDVAEVKDAVFRYLALLNAGDVSARADCYLSECTSFGVDGKPLTYPAGWRTAEANQTYDLRCRDLRVYVHKDTAIATAYLVGTIANPDGTPTRVSGRSSWVHLKQNGEWKIAHNHLSPLNPDA